MFQCLPQIWNWVEKFSRSQIIYLKDNWSLMSLLPHQNNKSTNMEIPKFKNGLDIQNIPLYKVARFGLIRSKVRSTFCRNFL